MNKNQKLVSTVLLVIGMSLWFSHAALSTGNRTNQVLPIEDLYESNSCSTTNNVYLDKDFDNDGLSDYGIYLNSNIMIDNVPANYYRAASILKNNNQTMVQYFRPFPNMIYKMTEEGTIGMLDDNTFWRASFVFPYQTPVRGIATTPNKVIFEMPYNNDTTKNTLGFVFYYKYAYAIGLQNTTTVWDYRYNQVPHMNYFLNNGVVGQTLLPGTWGNILRQWSGGSLTKTWCVNYKLSRCGDGITDSNNSGNYFNTFTWELCDDGPLNGTPGKCPLGCRENAWIARCGDNIKQEEWSQPYDENNDGVMDPDEISFEFCDDGDLTGDNGDGILNGDDPEANQCATNCQEPFYEVFDEVFDDA